MHVHFLLYEINRKIILFVLVLSRRTSRLNLVWPVGRYQKLKFEISPLFLLAPANTNRNICFFETIRKLHTNPFFFFLQIRIISFNFIFLIYQSQAALYEITTPGFLHQSVVLTQLDPCFLLRYIRKILPLFCKVRQISQIGSYLSNIWDF